MPIQIQTALITLGGVILGFAASFLLQGLQRRWALDDQRREWIRGEWEEFSKTYGKLGKILGKIYMNAKFTDDYQKEFEEYYSDLHIHQPPFRDSEIEIKEVRFMVESEKIFENGEKVDEEAMKWFVQDLIGIVVDIQESIKKQIEQTYK